MLHSMYYHHQRRIKSLQHIHITPTNLMIKYCIELLPSYAALTFSLNSFLHIDSFNNGSVEMPLIDYISIDHAYSTTFLMDLSYFNLTPSKQ